MKAVVYQGPRDVRVSDVPDAKIERPTDALVRITSTNICGSDLHMYEGRTDFEPGRTLGHENMGDVVEVGTGVEKIRVGDWVVLPFNISCGFCENCERGLTNYCLTIQPDPKAAGAANGFADMGPHDGAHEAAAPVVAGLLRLINNRRRTGQCLEAPELPAAAGDRGAGERADLASSPAHPCGWMRPLESNVSECGTDAPGATGRAPRKGVIVQVGYHSITWGGVVGHPQGVTSAKDLYYLTYGSMEEAVRDIAAAGYTGTEMFDGNLAAYADRPDELRGLLADNGVELVSVYTGAGFVYPDVLPDELDKVRRACELAATFGAERLVVGGGARRAAGTTPEDYDRLASALDQVQELARQHGLTASYHPHLTTVVESPEELEQLLPRTQIAFCPDTAHLAAGGGDPAALIRRYGDRVAHVHLKDVALDPVEFLPLGQGSLDFRDILSAVREAGYDSWLIVELDAYAGDPLEAAKISKAYLDQLLTIQVAEPGGELHQGRRDI